MVRVDQLPDGWWGRLMGEGRDPKVHLVQRQVRVPLVVTTVWTDAEGTHVQGILNGSSVPAASPAAAKLIGHIANLGYFIETSGPPGGPQHWTTKVRWVSDNWQVDLAPTKKADDLTKALKASGGYGLTQVCTLQRSDGQPFAPDEGAATLKELGDFLSFARGQRIACVLWKGQSGDGRVLREELRVPTVARWDIPRSWWDDHHGELLREVYPGFARLWRDPLWRHPLGSVVYWYTHSNTAASGVEGSLILSQAALEMLSWTFLVQARRSLSKQGFKDLRASDKIRLRLDSLGIPITVPQETIELQQAAKTHKWVDGPHALSEMRNALVHPDLERRLQYSNKLLRDVWQLAQWYIELAVLRVCGFSGQYSYRLGPPSHKLRKGSLGAPTLE